MTSWTQEDIEKLDVKYANEGVHLHQRPFRAVLELLAHKSLLDAFEDVEVRAIMDAYTQLVPELVTSWPGTGVGLIASVDRVRKFTLGLVIGKVRREAWQATGFQNRDEWWRWCRRNEEIGAAASFAWADLHDFVYGLGAIGNQNADATTLWRMAQSNLEDVANTLPSTFSVDTVVQPICMVAELAMKATLVLGGATPHSFKGRDGHNVTLLAERMTLQRPHRDDQLISEVVSRLPPYVDSRYRPVGLTRLEVVRLALGVQFIAASTVRRIATVDLAVAMEAEWWPGARRLFA